MSEYALEAAASKLIRAIERKNKLELYDTPIANAEVTVRWDKGCALAGYEETARAISIIVASHLEEFREQAIEVAERLVEEAKTEIRDALNGS
jgi:hypothetical protein